MRPHEDDNRQPVQCMKKAERRAQAGVRDPAADQRERHRPYEAARGRPTLTYECRRRARGGRHPMMRKCHSHLGNDWRRGLLMARGKCEGQNRMRAGCDRK